MIFPRWAFRAVDHDFRWYRGVLDVLTWSSSSLLYVPGLIEAGLREVAYQTDVF